MIMLFALYVCLKMELPILLSLEMRAVIRFLRAVGKNMADIYSCLCAVYGGNVMLAPTVCEWVCNFRND